MPDTVGRDKIHHQDKVSTKEKEECHRKQETEPEKMSFLELCGDKNRAHLAPVLLVLCICTGKRVVTSLQPTVLEMYTLPCYKSLSCPSITQKVCCSLWLSCSHSTNIRCSSFPAPPGPKWWQWC